MVRVEIAGRLTRLGVDELRWVLVESVTAPAGPSPAEMLGRPRGVAGAVQARQVRGEVVRMLLVWAVLAAGVGAAFTLAWLWLGAPR